MDFVSSEIQKELYIIPGEVAFVMTEETLELPQNMFCQLSTKRRLSHDGIILLGGFTVDPHYSGRLFFGLYNISSQDYPLIPGKKLIAGVFYKVDEQTARSFTTVPEALHDFPDDLVRMIRNYKPVSTEALSKEIENLKQTVSDLRDLINNDKIWRDEFKTGLKTNNEQIEKLTSTINDVAQKLGKEIDERKTDDAKLRMQNSVVKGIGLVLSALFGGGVVSLIVMYLAGILKIN
jgi:dUTPase